MNGKNLLIVLLLGAVLMTSPVSWGNHETSALRYEHEAQELKKMGLFLGTDNGFRAVLCRIRL